MAPKTPKTPKTPLPPSMFALGEKFIGVDPKFPLNAYESSVAAIAMYDGRMSYRIHFKNWSKNCDFWVPIGDEEEVMYKGTDVAAVTEIIKKLEERKGTLLAAGKATPKGKGTASTASTAAGPSAKTPAAKTPVAKTPAAKAAGPSTPASKTPAVKAAPKAASSAGKATPAAKTATTPAAKATPKTASSSTAAAAAKTPARPSAKTTASTPKPKATPTTTTAKTPAAKRAAPAASTPRSSARRSSTGGPPPAKKPALASRASPRGQPAAAGPPARRSRAESEMSEELGEPDSDEEQQEEQAPVVEEDVEMAEEDPSQEEEHDRQEGAEEVEQEAEEEEDEEEEFEEVTIELPTRDVNLADVRLQIPTRIRQLLVDDCSLVHYGYEAKLPAAMSIDEIVKRYERNICPGGYKEEDWSKILVEVKENIAENTVFPEALYILAARSFADYFNGNAIAVLYRRERKQHRRLILQECAKHGIASPDRAKLREIGFKPSSFYGYQHLIRAIATIPDYMAAQKWNDHMMETLLHGMRDFVLWLEDKMDDLYTRGSYVMPDLDEEALKAWEARRPFRHA